MNHRYGQIQYDGAEDESKDACIRMPCAELSTLINIIAIARWVVCDHGAASKPGLCCAVQQMEQLIYEQCHASGGADEIWRNPQDGTYHHPTFPEQEGEAWDAVEEYEEAILGMRIVDMASTIMARREEIAGSLHEDAHAHYEHLLEDVLEEQGIMGLMEALIAGRV